MYEEPTSTTLLPPPEEAVEAIIAKTRARWNAEFDALIDANERAHQRQQEGREAQERGDQQAADDAALDVLQIVAATPALTFDHPDLAIDAHIHALRALHAINRRVRRSRVPARRFARRSVRAARRHAGSTTRRTTRTGGGSRGDDGPASPPACSRTRSVPTLIGGAW